MREPSKKCARKTALGILDFAGAVGAELPAFISPQDGDHGEANAGEKGVAGLRGSERGGNFGGVRALGEAEVEKDAAEDHDESNFDDCGDVLNVGTLASSPDVYGGDDGDHQQGGERSGAGEVSGMISCK